MKTSEALEILGHIHENLGDIKVRMDPPQSAAPARISDLMTHLLIGHTNHGDTPVYLASQWGKDIKITAVQHSQNIYEPYVLISLVNPRVKPDQN